MDTDGVGATRLDVQRVIRPQGSDFRGYAGRLAGGRLAIGDAVTVLPSGRTSTISGLQRFGREVICASAGEAITVELADDIDVRPRRRARARRRAATDITAQHDRVGRRSRLLDDRPPAAARLALVVQARHPRRAGVRRLDRVAPRPADPRAEHDADELVLNDLAVIRLSLSEPIVAEPYALSPRGWSADPRRRGDEHHRRGGDDHRGGVTGFISLVGAGPGDPELLTVRGLRRLQAADVVVHDALVGTGVLALARPDAELIDVGKRAGRAGAAGADQRRCSSNSAATAAHVVRLKGGDPFVFGRGGEEALALAAAGVDFEVVPGVSSVVAAPAAAGIPVTQRGDERVVHRGHRSSPARRDPGQLGGAGPGRRHDRRPDGCRPARRRSPPR